MKKILTLFFFIISISFLSAQTPADLRLQVRNVTMSSIKELNEISKNIDLTKLSSKEEAKLKKKINSTRDILMNTYTSLDGYGTINKNKLSKIPALLDKLSNSVQVTKLSASDDISKFVLNVENVKVNATALFKNVK